MSLKGKKIILGVTGSIAAYKSATLIRLMVKAGAQVKVILSEGGAQFITPLALATVSKHTCLTSFTNQDATNWNNHVELGLWADLMLVAPASANTMAKMANGLCDQLLLGVYLSARCPVYIAPAMDEDMWKHPSTQANLDKLRSYGNSIIPVNSGELASGLVGPGRMAEPEEIVAFLETQLAAKKKSKLQGKKVLITAGPTYEPLDPVRFIGNHSTGKMGIALAEEAERRGAEVEIVLGPTSERPTGTDIAVEHVMTGKEMLQACENSFAGADICIFAAAVADYGVAEVATEKIKKGDSGLTLELEKTDDIAYTFGQQKRPDQLSVGFALETANEEEYAKKKLIKKNFDLIVLNSLRDKGAGFKGDTNKVTLIDKHNNLRKYELKSKQSVASDILDKVETLL